MLDRAVDDRRGNSLPLVLLVVTTAFQRPARNFGRFAVTFPLECFSSKWMPTHAEKREMSSRSVEAAQAGDKSALNHTLRGVH